MIKCNLDICAVISRAAVVKQGKDDVQFLSFSVKLPIEGRDGSKKDLEISVSTDGDKSKTSVYVVGRRVNLHGVLTTKKKDDKLFYNFRAEKVTLANSKDADIINGTIEFKGKLGKREIEVKPDKNGNTFKSFSGFSTDKDGDKAEFTWVRFLYFNPKEGEDFIIPSAYVHANGDLQLGVFKDDISIDCRIRDIEPWVLEHKNQ